MNFTPTREGPRINDEIGVPRVRLVDEKGQMVGVVGRREAENQSVALRRLGGKEQEALALGEAVARLNQEAAVPGSA